MALTLMNCGGIFKLISCCTNFSATATYLFILKETRGGIVEDFNCAKEGKLIFKECIQPKFKIEGFKKSGNTFYKSREEFIDVVNVQFGRSNSKDYSYFTYNIKISIPSFYEKFDLNCEKKVDCKIIECRLGSIICMMKNLFPVGYWYKIGHRGQHKDIISNLISNGCITPGITVERLEELKEELKTLNILENRYDFKNSEQIKKTIVSDIDTAIVPFFNRIDSYDKLVELLESRRFFIPIQEFFLFIYYMEKGETSKGIQFAKNLSSIKIYKDRIEKYLYDKDIENYIE